MVLFIINFLFEKVNQISEKTEQIFFLTRKIAILVKLKLELKTSEKDLMLYLLVTLFLRA